MTELRTLTSEQIREFDRAAAEQFGLSGRVLMENAGRAVADLVRARIPRQASVLLLCGKGNNGGDGFVAARHLDGAGYHCRVIVTASPDDYHGEAEANLIACQRAKLPLSFVSAADNDAELEELFHREGDDAACIVDALLGIGVQGAPRPPLAQLIRLANAHASDRIAVDIPSGLDADLGVPAEPTFRANATCTLAAAKPGLLSLAAAEYVGELSVAPLGAPRKLLEQFGLVPPREES